MFNNETDHKKEEFEDEFQAHKKYYKVYFSNNDMDFVFQWLLGSVVHGGCSIGECFYTASLMNDGDPQSWEKELTKLAERVEERGKDVLERKHFISAREQYLRAYAYYRAVLGTMVPNDPNFKINLKKALVVSRKLLSYLILRLNQLEFLLKAKRYQDISLKQKMMEKNIKP